MSRWQTFFACYDGSRVVLFDIVSNQLYRTHWLVIAFRLVFLANVWLMISQVYIRWLDFAQREIQTSCMSFIGITIVASWRQYYIRMRIKDRVIVWAFDTLQTSW